MCAGGVVGRLLERWRRSRGGGPVAGGVRLGGEWGVGGGEGMGGRYPQGVVAYEAEVEGQAGVEGVACECVRGRRGKVVGGLEEEGGVELGGEVG